MYENSNKRWKPVSSVKLPPLEREGFESSVLERDRWKKDKICIVSAASMREPYRIREDTGEKFAITKTETRVGKGESADIVIKGNNTISRSHAEIIFDGTRFFIQDLKSLNHPYVNGEIVTEKTGLMYGYVITLSEENFIFSD